MCLHPRHPRSLSVAHRVEVALSRPGLASLRVKQQAAVGIHNNEIDYRDSIRRSVLFRQPSPTLFLLRTIYSLPPQRLHLLLVGDRHREGLLPLGRLDSPLLRPRPGRLSGRLRFPRERREVHPLLFLLRPEDEDHHFLSLVHLGLEEHLPPCLHPLIHKCNRIRNRRTSRL